MTPLGTTSCERLSKALLELYTPVEPGKFAGQMLAVIQRLVHGHLRPFDRLEFASQRLEDHRLGHLALPEPDYLARWSTFASHHPIVRHHLHARREGICVYDLDEVLPANRRHRQAIETELFRPLSIRHQLAIMFPGHDAAMGVSVSRESCAFTSEDRLLLELFAPHALQARRNSFLMAKPETLPSDTRNLHWEELRSLGYSRRECDILEWLAQGKSDEDIAIILGLSKRTVSHHMLDLLAKFGASNRVSIVTEALRVLRDRRTRRNESLSRPVEAPAPSEADLYAHESALAGARTPAEVVRILRLALAQFLPGLGVEVRLIRLGPKGATAASFPCLSPASVQALTARLQLFDETAAHPAPSGLGAVHVLEDGIHLRKIQAGGYLWENLQASPGDLFAALVLPEEGVAFALTTLRTAQAASSSQLQFWQRLMPHAALAARNACRLLAQQNNAVLGSDTPPPESPLWQNLHSLGITARQGEILGWVAAGQRDEAIGKRLGVSPRTVNAHLRAAFEQLGVENRTSAVLEVFRHLALEAGYAN